MKIKYLISIITLLTLSCTLQAQQSEIQDKKNKSETIIIQTNGHCETCKNKIENELAFEKGIKEVVYDLSTSKVKVVYNPKKTNPDQIRRFIAKLGYDADDIKANNNHQTECKKHE
jgi:copper chaperone CopZ